MRSLGTPSLFSLHVFCLFFSFYAHTQYKFANYALKQEIFLFLEMKFKLIGM